LKSATNGVGGPLALLPRQIEWECRQAQAPGRSQPAEISVLQFNVLADGLCGRSPTLGGFTRPPREILEWAYRGPLLVEVRLTYHGLVIVLTYHGLVAGSAVLQFA
jgi:hypothetical protein